MRQTNYVRKGKNITTYDDNGKGTTKKYDYINEAKRESRRLQISEDGGLGRGCLMVI